MVAKKSVDMNNLVFSEDQYSTISFLFSTNVLGVINKAAGSYKDKLEALYKFVKDKKEELKPFLAQGTTVSSSSDATQPSGSRDDSSRVSTAEDTRSQEMAAADTTFPYNQELVTIEDDVPEAPAEDKFDCEDEMFERSDSVTSDSESEFRSELIHDSERIRFR